MTYKSNFVRIISFVIISFFWQIAVAGTENKVDLKIIEAKLYFNDVLKTGISKKYEYKEYSNGDNWSKLRKMSLHVKLINNGLDVAIAVKVIPELYFLFKKKLGGRPFPSISQSDPKNNELGDILKKDGLWVWNRNLGSKGKKILKHGEVLELEFNDLDISNPYYAMRYTISAFAVRVYTFSNQTDSQYSDNVQDLIYLYPM